MTDDDIDALAREINWASYLRPPIGWSVESAWNDLTETERDCYRDQARRVAEWIKRCRT